MMSNIVSQLVDILVAGISNIATGIGSGLNALVTNAFVSGSGTTESPYTLTAFGGVIAVFGGIALAIGLSTLVVKWVMSLGARN